MTSRGLVVFCALMLASCGKSSKETSRKEVFPQTFSNSVVELEKQVSSCSQKLFTIAELGFPSFQNAFIAWPQKDFSPLLQDIYLRDGKVIGDMRFGEIADWLKVKEGYRIETIRGSQPLFVCPEVTTYERETVEAAGLHAAYFIHKTNSKFTALVKDIKVEPVTVNIGPQYTESFLYEDNDGTVKKSSYFLSDNAFYAPSAHAISFLPHSTFMRAMNFKMNFFEVPMIAAHEYGHHLFQMIYKYDYVPGGVSHHQGCFGGDHLPKQHNKELKRLDLRKIKNEDVLNAYNEGFADLVAFYSLDENERGVRDVKCLEVSRDVRSSVFYDGQEKKFSEEAVRSFFSPYTESLGGSCETISFQGIHNFGAIFAHSADSFLSELTNSDDEKLLAVVEWVKFLRSSRKRYLLSSPERFFRSTMEEFVRLSLKRFDRKFDKTICQKIDNYFPSHELTECR